MKMKVDASGYTYLALTDEFGKQIERTPATHPYSYDAFVTYRNGENNETKEVLYSDRLLQWNHEKTRKLMKKHFKNDGDYYSQRAPKDIEAFLSEYLEKDIKLILIMEGCNQSSGYPYWVFFIGEKH